MPKLIENATDVAKWMQEKQQLEAMLAWDLLETFNSTNELIEPLRAMAKMALNEIFGLALGTEKTFKAVKAAIEDEKKASMKLLNERIHLGDSKGGMPPIVDSVNPNSMVAGLARVLDEVGGFDAQACSDVIRLYGTVVEKAAPELPAYKKLLDEKMGMRKGTGGLGDNPDDVWNQGTVEKEGVKIPQLKGRHRFRFEADTKAGAYKKAIEAAGATTVQGFLVSMKGGQSLFGLKDTSTIGKLDRVFGLVPAADISGTTTDTLFFMRKFFNSYGHALDPIFDLLPLATIVAGAHHSLLEVAAALSVNNIIDYTIGFYTTLMPKRTGAKHAGIANIEKALQAAEKAANVKVDGTHAATNRHMIAFYSGKNKVQGCYLYDASEAGPGKPYFKFANCNAAMKFFGGWKTKVDGWPAKDEIFKMLNEQKLL